MDTVEHAVAVVDRLLEGHDNIQANFAALTDGVDAAKLAVMAAKHNEIENALAVAGDAAEAAAQLIKILDFTAADIDTTLGNINTLLAQADIQEIGPELPLEGSATESTYIPKPPVEIKGDDVKNSIPGLDETKVTIVKEILDDKENYPKQFMKMIAIKEKAKEFFDSGKYRDNIENADRVFPIYEAVISENASLIEAAQDVCENMYEGKGITISDEHKDKEAFKKAQRECARREVELRPDRVYSKPVFVFESTDVKINDDKVNPVTKDFILAENSALFGGNGTITFKGLPVEFSLNIIVDDVRNVGFEEVMNKIALGREPYKGLGPGNLEINDGNGKVIVPKVARGIVSFTADETNVGLSSMELSGFFKASRAVSRQGIIEKESQVK